MNKKAAIQVLTKLREAGFEALFAGGSVRDELIGRKPKDYDVATNATPKQVCCLFKRRIEVGAKFGVVIVLIGSEQIEVATFRADGGYSDGRRPDSVRFSEPKEDALRRDFTINGMFYDPLEETVIDFVGGKEDIKSRLIRTIGLPQERFNEDFLRLLRAIRFSAELDFEIERRTWQAIKQLAEKIVNVSGERIAAELERLLACENRAKGIKMLAQSGLCKFIFPLLSDKELEIGIAVLEHLNLPVTIEKGLAGLFIGCEADLALKLAQPLKLSNRQNKAIGWILENREKLYTPDMPNSKLRPLLADEWFDMLFDVQKAFQIVKGEPFDNLEKIADRFEKLKGKALLPSPLLNGNDVIELGAVQGPQVGRICKKLYNMQLDEDIKNKQQAIEAAKQLILQQKSKKC